MANGVYDNGLNEFANGNIDWVNDPISAVLVDSSYTPNLTSDGNLDDIPGGAARVATQALSSKTTSGGVCDAADTVFTSVTGNVVEQMVIYANTGVEATSTLIALFDTGTGLPITPNGGDITAQYDDGANKIFKL